MQISPVEQTALAQTAVAHTQATPCTSLVVTPHPLTTHGQQRVVFTQAGDTLAQMLAPHNVNEHWVVELGGVEVPYILWGKVRPKLGQLVEARPRLQEGDVKNAVGVLALVAVVWFSSGLAAKGVFGFAGGSFGAAVVAGATVAVGTRLVTQAFFPQPSVAAGNDSDLSVASTYNLSGIRNQARMWRPMALVLGEPFMVPDLAAQPFSWFSGEDVWLQGNFHFGLNCYTISNISIGDTLISNFKDVQLFSKGMSPPTGATNNLLPTYNAIDTVLGGLLTCPSFQTFTTYDFGSIPANAVQVVNLGGIFAPFYQYTVVTSPDANWVTRTSSPDAIGLQLDFEASLVAVNNDGNYVYQSVEVEVQYKPTNSATWLPWPGAGFANGKVLLWSADGKPLRKTFSLQVADANGFDIRARKNFPDVSSTRASNSVTWSSLKTIQKDTASHSGEALLAVQIKATGQINGTLDEVSAMARANPHPHWTGSAWATAQYRTVTSNGTTTDGGLSNPGSIFLLLCRGIYDTDGNLLAGLGLSDDLIDIGSIKAFTVWCASNNFYFDFVLQEPASHEELLSRVAAAGMGTLNRQGGKVGVQFYQPSDIITGVINMANTKVNSFGVGYMGEERADELEFGYYDRSDKNSFQSLRVLAPGVTTPRKTARIDMPGISSEAHAAILARRTMAENIYLNKSISLEMDAEALTFQRGSVVALSHDLTQWGYGGRVQSVTQGSGTLTLGLDDAIPATSPSGSTNRFIGLRIAGETTYRILAVQAFTGTARSVTIPSAWATSTHLNTPARDWVWIYDFKPTPGQKCWVTRIEPSDDLSARLTLVPVPDEFWPYVFNGTYVAATKGSLLNTSPVASNIRVAEYLVRSGSSFAVRLVVDFDVSGQADRSEVQISGTNASSALVAQTVSTLTSRAEFTVSDSAALTITVTPINARGTAGTVATATYTVAGVAWPPSDVTGFTAAVETNGIRLSWAAPADLDYAETVVRQGSSWDTGTEVWRGSSGALLAWRSAGAYTLWAKHYDTSGNASAAAVSATLTVAAPAAPSALSLAFGTASIEASWSAPAVGATQQPLDRVELSWTSSFTTVIDAKKATTTTFGWMTAGSYTLFARYVDVAGNIGAPSSASLQVLPPNQPAMTAAEAQVNAVTLRWQDAKSSQPIRKYAIYYGDAGTAFASATLYGSAGADSRSDVLFFRSSGNKVAYLLAEDVAGNVSAPRQIDLLITMPTNFVLATEYYQDWQSAELTNATIVGGAQGQIILPAFNGRTWGERLSNNGWTTAQQKIDAGYPIVVQPVPASGKHVEQHDIGKVIASGQVRVVPTVLSSVAGCTATIRIRASDGDATTTWQPWLLGETASFKNFRYVEVEYAVESDSKGFVVLDDLYVRVEIAEILESATLVLSATDTNGTPYVCTKPFVDVRSVQVSPLASPNIARFNPILDDSTQPAKVFVQAWDTNNNRTGGTVSLLITGV